MIVTDKETPPIENDTNASALHDDTDAPVRAGLGIEPSVGFPVVVINYKDRHQYLLFPMAMEYADNILQALQEGDATTIPIAFAESTIEITRCQAKELALEVPMIAGGAGLLAQFARFLEDEYKLSPHAALDQVHRLMLYRRDEKSSSGEP